MSGRTGCLFGMTGSGKTSLLGEYAKHKFKTERKRTVIHASDLGGLHGLDPLIKAGVIIPNIYTPSQDIWGWINDACTGKGLAEDIGFVAFDSGTSQAEFLLQDAVKQGLKGIQLGTQKIVKSTLPSGQVVGANTESQYGLIQTWHCAQIWESTWLTQRGLDVFWTFSVFKGEKADDSLVLGPKLAGRALTAYIPQWFNYTWYVAERVQGDGSPPQHILYCQASPELAGMGMAYGNARYPLDAQTQLPASISPASLVRFFSFIEEGQKEAEEALRVELALA